MVQILQGDWIERLIELPDQSVQCCVTSPPYWGLRDYGVTGQLGLEKTPDEYVTKLVTGFREVRRVLCDDGTLWLNLGDSYFGDSPARKASSEAFSKQWDPKDSAGNGGTSRSAARCGDLKPKDLVGIPWMVAFALRSDGWYLRCDIIWHKPNPMPESVTDRPTKAHEYIFLFSKSGRYFYDAEAIKEVNRWPDHNRFGNKDAVARRVKKLTGNMAPDAPEETDRTGCNKRSVWTVVTTPYRDAHFATFPPELIKPCILAGSRHGETILDPFAGSGTTGQVALELGRKAALIELNPKYVEMINQRTKVTIGLNL